MSEVIGIEVSKMERNSLHEEPDQLQVERGSESMVLSRYLKERSC
jgi:hypothetical protein